MSNDILVLAEHRQGQVADITSLLLAAARHLAGHTGGRVEALLLGHQVEQLGSQMAADTVLYADDPGLADFVPESYAAVLATIIKERAPRAVLLGHTTVGTDVASALSVRLELPLVSQCQAFPLGDDGVSFLSQMCGGKMLAEGPLPGPTALVTMVPGGFKPADEAAAPTIERLAVTLPDKPRVRHRAYELPEAADVDITREPLLIAVGRGLTNEDDLELVEELAEALGAAVCATRPLVDQGWLAKTRLVGRSGHTVKPRLYLALGISGAPEHVQGITGSDLIIAVNTDPGAPIFDVARYGLEADLLDVVEAMLEQASEQLAV